MNYISTHTGQEIDNAVTSVENSIEGKEEQLDWLVDNYEYIRDMLSNFSGINPVVHIITSSRGNNLFQILFITLKDFDINNANRVKTALIYNDLFVSGEGHCTILLRGVREMTSSTVGYMNITHVTSGGNNFIGTKISGGNITDYNIDLNAFLSGTITETKYRYEDFNVGAH